MFLYIQNEKIEFANDPEQIDVIIKVINDHILQKELKLSHLLVDAVPVYDGFYDYLIKHFRDIKTIEVICLDLKEMVENTLSLAYDYIKTASPLIVELAEGFYRKPDEKIWSSLNDLFDGLQWIIESLAKIENFGNLEGIINDYVTWNEYVQCVSNLNPLAPQLEQALVDKDYVSVGDLLLYEVIPVFEVMMEKLVFLLPKQEENCVS